MKKPTPERSSLLVGTVAAIAAFACCALPSILVSVGIGAAWASQLRALEQFFPVLAGISVAAFGYGFYLKYARRRKPKASAPEPWARNEQHDS